MVRAGILDTIENFSGEVSSKLEMANLKRRCALQRDHYAKRERASKDALHLFQLRNT
jgi:hypothetical protein